MPRDGKSKAHLADGRSWIHWLSCGRSFAGHRRFLAIIDNLDEFYSPAWKKANLESICKVGSFDFFEEDICSLERMREIVARVRPDTIIHLAARAGVRPSIDQPRLYEQVNVAGAVNLLELCKEFQVSRFVLGSRKPNQNE